MKTTKRSRAAATQAQRMAQTLRRALFESMLRCADGASDNAASRSSARPGRSRRRCWRPAYPESTRQAMCTLYEICLQHYRSVAGGGTEKSDDARAAVAHFVAANMQALQGIDVTPSMLQRLHGQLAMVTRLSSRWDRASLRERQLFFEKMAIVAVLVDQAWSRATTQGPAAIEHVQRGARGYLRELLGLEPDGLTLSESGLGLAPAALGA